MHNVKSLSTREFQRGMMGSRAEDVTAEEDWDGAGKTQKIKQQLNNQQVIRPDLC